MKFNEVTWYSKLAAIIFFIGVLPSLTFYIGVRYEQVQNIVGEQSVETPAIFQKISQKESSLFFKDIVRGYSFSYPQQWSTGEVNSDGFDLYDTKNPFGVDQTRVNKGIMTAQFQYHHNNTITDKQQYIKYIVQNSGGGPEEGGSKVDIASIVPVKNDSGLDVFKYPGGISDLTYIIPLK